ncbi:RNA polymerase sigma factor [Ferruginibacter sp.]|uniref:RNA polymerase sigma factor n=1 Tax=Ferruginibacter sp. TaxID=1940288 RepID=UPI00199B2CA7|nr:RNA polymerase sigma factor [Ferruginibacter sp.]MBC7625878.1 RNA polymerase sigma factor [Ferruginibacter sp.]
MLNQSEKTLIKQLQQGDRQAFSTVVGCYQDMVYNTAISIVQNEEDAADITQDVFVQVFQSVGSFKGDAKFSTWLYRIVIAKALDHEKRKKRKKRFGFIQSLYTEKGEAKYHPEEFNHPGIQLENKEKAGELFKALKQIPANQRIAFMLNKIEGLNNQEIAVIMNTSFYAVESLLARAKNNLKKSLKKYYLQSAKQSSHEK